MRIHQELHLQIALGPALMAIKGQALRKWNVYTPAPARCVSRWGAIAALPHPVGTPVIYNQRGDSQAIQES